jgi:hypothetical protein
MNQRFLVTVRTQFLLGAGLTLLLLLQGSLGFADVGPHRWLVDAQARLLGEVYPLVTYALLASALVLACWWAVTRLANAGVLGDEDEAARALGYDGLFRVGWAAYGNVALLFLGGLWGCWVTEGAEWVWWAALAVFLAGMAWSLASAGWFASLFLRGSAGAGRRRWSADAEEPA